MNSSAHTGWTHLNTMSRFPELAMFFQGGISVRFQLRPELGIQQFSFLGWTAGNRFGEQCACFSSVFEVPFDRREGNTKQVDYFSSGSSFIHRTYHSLS